MLASLLILQSGSAALLRADAADRYTLLKYSGVIELDAEERVGDYQRVSVNTKIGPFTLTLIPASGSNNLVADWVDVPSSFTGNYYDNQRKCSGSISGTFTFRAKATASLEDETTFIEYWRTGDWKESGGAGSSCTFNTGVGVLSDALSHCFSNRFGAKCAWYEILGNTFPVAGNPEASYSWGKRSYSGTAGQTLVDSKKEDAFDFSVTVTPAEITRTVGQPAAYKVKVSLLKGEVQPVSLSAIVNMSTTYYSPVVFTPSQGTPPFESEFKVSTTQAARPGRYTVLTIGKSETLSRSGNLVALVVPGPSWLPSNVDVKDDTVKIEDLVSPLSDKLTAIGKIFQEVAGKNAIITSGDDGSHCKDKDRDPNKVEKDDPNEGCKGKSKHYSDKAIDIRIQGIDYKKLKEIVERLDKELPSNEFSILLTKQPRKVLMEELKKKISERIFLDPGRVPHIHIQYNGKLTPPSQDSLPQIRFGDTGSTRGLTVLDRGGQRYLLPNGASVGADDIIETGKDGFIRMVIFADSTIDTAPSSSYHIKQFSQASSIIEIIEGKIRVGAGLEKQYSAPLIEVEGVLIKSKGTEYIVEVDDDLKVTVTVLHGSVEVEDTKNGQKGLVEAGRLLVIPTDPAGQTLEAIEKRMTQMSTDSLERWWPPLPSTTTTLSLPSNTLTYGKSTTVEGTLTPADAVGDIRIQHSRDQQTWTDITSTSTVSGRFSYGYAPEVTGTHYLRAIYPGGGRYQTSTSQPFTLTVQPIKETFKVTVDGKDFPVTALSNSTLSDTRFDQASKSIQFTTKGVGTKPTTGVIELTFPSNLINGTYTVILDNAPLEFKQTLNSTHTTISTSHQQTDTARSLRITGTVVVPEFPPNIFIVLFVTLGIALALQRTFRKVSNPSRHEPTILAQI